MAIRAILRLVLVSILIALVLPSSGQAQKTKGELPLVPSVSDGEATQVFVLGTPHLSEMADQFETSMVDSLVATLDAFGPDAIAIENVSGRQAAAMERWGGRWAKVAERFAGTFLYYGQKVQENTSWSWSEANQRADSLLTVARSVEDDFTSSDRVRLIKSLIASYRLPSATLQWAYYRSNASAAPPSLPDTVITGMNERLDAAGEVYSIGLRLAREGSHQRLYPIDHQAEKDLAVPFFRSLMKAIGDSIRTALETHPVLQRVDSLEKAGLKKGGAAAHVPLFEPGRGWSCRRRYPVADDAHGRPAQ